LNAHCVSREAFIWHGRVIEGREFKEAKNRVETPPFAPDAKTSRFYVVGFARAVDARKGP